MRYKRYEKGGSKVSVLGFGVMRLPPRRKGNRGGVNFTRSVAVMRRAMESGVNLFDSHHMYHGGLSEEAIGRALKGWKGQRIIIQTKTPFYEPKPQSHYKQLIEQALEKTGVNCIDYLLFHSLKLEEFKKRIKAFFRLTDWAMKHGYVRRRGFSSHDTPQNVKKFIDSGEFSIMLVSYNWLNSEMAKTIRYGAEKGLGVSIMNPVGGGALATNTAEILRLLRGAKSAPEIAMRYALSTPGVSVAFSGMNAIEQVDENVAVANRKVYMTPQQRKGMLDKLKGIKRRGMLICTSCGYCMSCSNGVDIPGNLRLLSQAKLLGLREHGITVFRGFRQHADGDRSAIACTKCGRCLPKCPNDIPIIDRLAETAELLTE